MNATNLSETLLRQLTDLADCFDAPCVVELPRVAQELIGRNADVAGFTDEPEFATLPRFRRWSITQPVYVAESFDFVLMFAGDRRPAEVFAALRVLAHFRFDTSVVVVAATGNAARVASALERFDVSARSTIDGYTVLANFELP